MAFVKIGPVPEAGRSFFPLRIGGLGRAKALLYRSHETDLRRVLEGQAEGQDLCGRTADHREGVAAFFHPRRPEYTGR